MVHALGSDPRTRPSRLEPPRPWMVAQWVGAFHDASVTLPRHAGLLAWSLLAVEKRVWVGATVEIALYPYE